MKRIFLVIALIISFLIGFVAYASSESYSRLQDEYYYIHHTLRALFSLEHDQPPETIEELNQLLYVHLNRYLVAKSLTPSFLAKEIDWALCASFGHTSEEHESLKPFITNEHLRSYIEEKLDFCPGGAIVLI